MTSSGSEHRFSFSSLIPDAVFLGIMAAFGMPLFMICIVAVFALFGAYCDHVRRASMYEREDGVYVWIEWHGGERCSSTDPSEPGGDWDCDGDGGGGD